MYTRHDAIDAFMEGVVHRFYEVLKPRREVLEAGYHGTHPLHGAHEVMGLVTRCGARHKPSGLEGP